MKGVELWRHVGQGRQTVCMQIFVLKKKSKMAFGRVIDKWLLGLDEIRWFTFEHQISSARKLLGNEITRGERNQTKGKLLNLPFNNGEREMTGLHFMEDVSYDGQQSVSIAIWNWMLSQNIELRTVHRQLHWIDLEIHETINWENCKSYL